MGKILVFGVSSLGQQTVIEVVLEKHKVQFAKSIEEATRSCRAADVLAIRTDHEHHVPTCLKCGFKGVVVPLLVGKKQGMRIGEKFVEAISIRNLPSKVLEIFGQPA